MKYGRIFLLSPVRDFHRRIASDRMTVKLYGVLTAQLQWARDMLTVRDKEVRTILECAPIKECMSSKELVMVFGTELWNRTFRKGVEESIAWCDCIGLMPECRRVESDDIGWILSLAKRSYLPVVDVEKLIGISEGSCRQALDEIEFQHMNAREHSKVLQRGGRQK